MKKLIIPIGILMTGVIDAQQTSPSTTENFVYSKTYLDYNISGQPTKVAETVQYFDGLGRPKQVVNVRASPLGKDVVTHIEYDGFGRQAKEFLPVPQAGTLNGAIVPSSLANATQPDIYGSEKIFSEKVFQNSPLDRVVAQRQIGNAWEDKPVAFWYDAVTTEDAVKKFTTTTTWENGATKSTPSNAGIYQVAQLYKNTVTDEDGNQTIEFKNGRGQVILLRKVVSASENADTYYVYNEYNQLAFVVPPLLAKIKSWSQADQDNLAYEYRYDGRNRLVEKKLPVKGWELMIYDKQDRLVGTQDAELRKKGQWLYTKYDQFGRIAYTGINTGSSRIAEQTQADSFGSNNVDRGNTVFFSRQGMGVYYGSSDITYPKSPGWVTLLSLNYYDSYPVYSFNPSVSEVLGETVLTGSVSDGKSTKGLPVMSFVKNIEDDNWTKNYTYYDTRGRVVGTYSINHLGGYTQTESKLDFAGVPQTVITKHKRLTSDTERVITENFTYDHQNRLLVHKHKVDSNPEEILAQNKYNELSQLESKKVGGVALGSPLQRIDFKYNIRGWLTKVNDPNNLNGKLFGYEIKYQNSSYSNVSSGKYNGNISEIDWSSADNEKLRRYNYKYDRLDRLKNGIYSEPNSTVPQNNYYNETLEYDINGNIFNLQRNRFVENTGVELMDNLSYTYSGNRLNTVTDASGNYGGYPDTSGNIITYDDNGNMKNHVDKGILQIDYNHLNLPTYIKFDKEYYSHVNWDVLYNENTKYLYRADGIKLKKIYTYGSGRTSIEETKTTDYLDGFQYVDNLLNFAPTAEGYYDFVQNKYIYQYKDHIGNIRLAYYKGTLGAAQIDRTTNYYPFGLEFGGELNISSSISPNYPYSTQEQEKQQETGWSSFKWRNYDPAMGRFFNVDPLSEKYYTWSTYAFSGNRVVDARELEGLEPMEINKTTKNLVIVNQGWVRANPPDGATQSQNFVKTNKDGGIDYSGIGVINNLNSAKTQVGVFGSSSTENTKNDILSSINSFRKQSPDGKLIMVGHSRGADNLIELVNEHTEVKVDLLFTLDIAAGWDSDNIPSNVKTAVNYYNKNDGFMGSSIGGEDIEAKNPSKTKILNVPVNASHTEIDNKYRYNAYNAVVKELNKSEEKKP